MKVLPILKKIKSFFAFKCSNKFILYFLGFIGFTTSFNSMCTVDYGVPTADFVVNGSVKSEKTKLGIQHIQVIMGYDSFKSMNDTAYSDSQGKFSTSIRGMAEKQTFLIKIKDIDSTNYGTFLNKDTTIYFDGTSFYGHHGKYYKGKSEQDIVIYLVPKNE